MTSHRRARTMGYDPLAAIQVDEETLAHDETENILSTLQVEQQNSDIAHPHPHSHPHHVSELEDEPIRERLLRKAIEEKNEFFSIILKWEEITITSNQEMIAEDFLNAMTSILIVVNAMGIAMQFIKADLTMQIDRVRTACMKNGAATLQRLIIIEASRGKGTEALIWLKRTLSFVEIMMTKFEKGATLAESVDFAYMETLHDAHAFIVRAIAKNIKYTLPEDHVFLSRLNKDHELVYQGIRLFLKAMRPSLRCLVGFYNERNIEDVPKCQRMPGEVII